MQDVRPPKATLRGLGAFAKHCPHLKELCIAVDARGVGEEPPTQTAEGIISVDLHLSWADNEVQNIATFIVRMWPSMKSRGFTMVYLTLPEGQVDLWRTIDKHVDQYKRQAASVVFD